MIFHLTLESAQEKPLCKEDLEEMFKYLSENRFIPTQEIGVTDVPFIER